MELSTKFVSLPTMILGRSGPVSTVLPPCRRNQRFHLTASKRVFVMAASRGGGDYVGRSVDEDMIVLRMRLQEMKAAEMGHSPPSDWMEWEKNYYDHYMEDVCGAVGLVQYCLMNLRPSLGLGMVALIALTVPSSTGIVLFRAFSMILDTFTSS